MSSVPDPDHVKPWYLRNITEALALNEETGNVYMRTGFTGNIVIEGNVNIPETIAVNSTPTDPVHVHVSEIGTSGILDVPYLPIDGNVIVTSGNIHITNTPNVHITNTPDITGNVIVSGNANITNTPNVHITNTPDITGNVIVTSGNINANVTQGTVPWVVLSSSSSIDSAPFEWQIARGLVPNAIPINIFGYNTSIGNNPQTVWDVATEYIFPAVASQLTIVSTSASDNTSAKILILGLDASWNMINEVVTLNGTANVTTSASFLRINQILMTHPGSGQKDNVGTITAKISETIYAQINPTISKTQMGLYSVPAGYTLYITQVTALSGDAAGASKYMNFQCDILNNVTGVNFLLLHATWQNIYQVQRVIPIAQTEKQDIRWQLYTNSGTYSGSIIVEGALLKN